MPYVSAPSLDNSRRLIGRTLSKPSAPVSVRKQPQHEAMPVGSNMVRLQAKPPTHRYPRSPIDSIFLDSPDPSYMSFKPPTGQPAFPPPKAMKILGYPGVVEDSPVKSSPAKKPVLHRIQTSFSSKSVPSSPVEDKFWGSQGKDLTIKHGKKSAKASKAELELNNKSAALHKSNSKHFRPLPYAAAVQINMFMDGGSEEDWLARSRKLDVNNGVKEKEVVGIRDENGRIWLDADERTEFTSLIPKEGDEARRGSYDPWVDFNDERLNSAVSTGSSGSWVSSDRPIMEVESVMAHHQPSDFGFKRPAVTMPGAYLFPVDIGGVNQYDEDETIRFKAPKANTYTGSRKAPPAPLKLAPLASQSTVVLSSFHGHHKSQSLGNSIGFDDHFLRGNTNDSRAAASMEQLPTTKDRGMKRGVGPSLRAMWGK